MKLFLIIVALIAIGYFVGIDAILWAIGGGILFLILLGLFSKGKDQSSADDPNINKKGDKQCTAKKRHIYDDDYAPNFSSTSYRTPERPRANTTPKVGGTSISNPFHWTEDKEYVPGVGYRDKYGKYYSTIGLPIVTPVDTEKKRR